MTPERRTLTLTERESSLCRLDGDDVEFLLAHHRTHMELRPTRERETYQLQPRGYVGVINAPHSRISIRPKIPLQNLCYLLDANVPEDLGDDQGEPAPGAEVANILGLRLARLMAERAAAGLHRGYAERREQGPHVQGKIDVAEQLRSNLAHKERVACEFEELTPDVAYNQIPRSTAEWLLATGLLADPARRQLRQALSAFQNVSTIPLRGREFPIGRLGAEPSWESYRPLLFLCRLLLENLGASDRVGTAVTPAFLVSLEGAFEHFCTRRLMDHLATRAAGQEFRVVAQHPAVPHALTDGLPRLQFRPDVVITSYLQQCGLLVMDTKWKSSPFVRADLYQILSYCAALGFSQGMLVYPGRRDRTWRYAFPGTGNTIYIEQLRVTGDLAACKRATERWLHKVERLCRRASSR